jgi:MYXO-CTERM domain-containing protein
MMARALALAALLAPTLASAYQLKTDPTGATIRLAQTEVTFRLPARIPDGLDAEEVEAAIRGALDGWAQVTGLTFKLVAGDPDAKPGYVANGENHNDILFVEQGWQWDDNALAATLLAIDTTSHTIVDADIVLNATQHRFRALSADHTPSGIYDDLQNTLSHEMGHVIGLAHTDVTAAVMFPDAPKGEVAKRVLKEDDIDGARAIYQSGKGGTSPDPTVPTDAQGLQGVAQGMASIGCSSASGGSSPAALWALAALGFWGLRRRST